MDYLVTTSKCLRKTFRGSITIDSISAGETKVITINFEDALSEDAVCVTSAVGWPLESSVQAVNTHAVIISVTNQSETGIANVDLNYLVL
jgi:hypothetical protein